MTERQTKYSQIAHAMPFTKNYFYEWKKRGAIASLDYLKCLAEYFNVSPTICSAERTIEIELQMKNFKAAGVSLSLLVSMTLALIFDINEHELFQAIADKISNRYCKELTLLAKYI